MKGGSNQNWELVLYDHSRGKTQIDIENDYNDPIHWYNGNNFNSELAVGEIKREMSSDANTIFDYIKTLSNDEMKDQDHYLILGLDHLRYRATISQIKLAYRKACLLFHPDRHHSKYELPDSQFVHITRAYEVLSDPEKRQSYDSVDEEIDDSIPTTKSANTSNFYELYGRALYRNARWSINQPVPLVGNEKTSYEHAQKFYDFWLNFRSKREFSHLDEQPVDSGDCREERRYVAKLNKKQREENKKKELKRIKQLIDSCRACDPRRERYIRIKGERVKLEKEEKKKRQQMKKASRNGFSMDKSTNLNPTQAPTEGNRTQNTSQSPNGDVNANSSADDDKEKKIQQRELKKQLKKQLDDGKHKLRAFVEKHNYFVKSNEDSGNKLKNIEKFDKFIKIIQISDVEELNLEFERLNLDFDGCLNVFKNKLDVYYTPTSEATSHKDNNSDKKENISQKDNNENISHKENDDNNIPPTNGFHKIPLTETKVVTKIETTSATTSTQKQDKWTKQRILTLMKAMKMYPAGTKSRYEIVTEYINQHAKCNFAVKQIIEKSKTLTVNQDTNVVKMVVEQKSKKVETPHNGNEVKKEQIKEQIQINGCEIPHKNNTKDPNDPSNINSTKDNSTTNCAEWTADEQKIFQEALKTIPIKTSDRWIKIATLIPTKTPLQCQQRLKHLCEMIKKKRESHNP